MLTRVIKAGMNQMENDNLKDLYKKWLAAKGRYEMAAAMDTAEEHKNNFETYYKTLSKELYNELRARGCTTKEQMEKALDALKEKKPTLTLIKGGQF
jgi:hypothetical protein